MFSFVLLFESPFGWHFSPNSACTMGFWCINLVPRISESWPRAPRPQVMAACCLNDIGTKILYFQCFVTTDMFLFCKPIFFSGNCRIFRDLAFGSIKTRFKAILKKLDVSSRSTCSWTFAPGGRLRYEAYNVEVSKYPRIKITKVRIGYKLPKI